MDRRIRLLCLGGVVVIALSASLILSPPEGSISVDDLMAEPDDRIGDTMAVRGIVENGSYDASDETFTLLGEDDSLKVLFGGVGLSSAFSEGKTVLVTGELQQQGGEWVLHAEEVQVGCPSKYEAVAETGQDHPSEIEV